MSVKLLTEHHLEFQSLKEGCTGSPESTLVNKYFIERCVRGCKSKDFWPTVKPFLTNKGTQVHKDTVYLKIMN